jgi:hypothetical protein
MATLISYYLFMKFLLTSKHTHKMTEVLNDIKNVLIQDRGAVDSVKQILRNTKSKHRELNTRDLNTNYRVPGYKYLKREGVLMLLKDKDADMLTSRSGNVVGERMSKALVPTGVKPNLKKQVNDLINKNKQKMLDTEADGDEKEEDDDDDDGVNIQQSQPFSQTFSQTS